MSVADIVGQLTGERPTETQILMVAEQTPSEVNPGTKIYKPDDGGISVGDLPVLFKHYGIKSVNSDTSGPDATGLNALEQYLGAGRKVIAFVNSRSSRKPGTSGPSADHFVVVTGVDTRQKRRAPQRSRRRRGEYDAPDTRLHEGLGHLERSIVVTAAA